MISFEVTQDIKLKMLEESEAETLFTLVDENRLYLREWLPWLDFNLTTEESLAFIKSCRKQYSDDLGFNGGIYYRDRLLGMCGFHQIDRLSRKVSIGYWIAQDAQGQGTVTACVKFLIDYAFNELDLNKVSIPAAEYNHKSQAVPKRLGLAKEGIERDAEFLYDHYVNHVHYSVLRSEWMGYT